LVHLTAARPFFGLVACSNIILICMLEIQHGM